MTRSAALLAAILSAIVLIGAARRPPLAVTVTPSVASAPVTVVVVLRLTAPVETDRVLTVEVDGPDYVRSSAWEIDGRGTRRERVVDWRDLRGHGEGLVTARVGDGWGHWRAAATTRLLLVD